MPTYEYECQNCGYRFEKLQKITESHLKSCPKCKKTVKRLIGTGSGIIFKGSGFYATDYRSKEYKEKAKQESQKNCPVASPNKCETCEKNKPRK